MVKPYNSVLGEHFRSHWDVIPVSYPSDPSSPPVQHLYLTAAAAESTYSTLSPHANTASASTTSLRSDTASMRSGKSGKSVKSAKSGVSMKSGKSSSFLSSVTSHGTSAMSTPNNKSSTPATSPELFETELDLEISKLNLSGSPRESETSHSGAASIELIEADDPVTPEAEQRRVRIAYLTEQVSHHPPVSAYSASCPSRQVSMAGIDQISAKVSGTTVRVTPGSFNKGIFVHIDGGAGEGETYRITHPPASVNGILRGSFYVTVSESTIITCSGGKDGKNLRAIIEYKDESWLGRAHFLCEGVVHEYDPEETTHEEWTRVKHVPRSRVVATFEGSYRHLIKWKRVDEDECEWKQLLDLSQLQVIPKQVRPLERQEPNESRRLWDGVTSRLLSKEYSEANRHKQAIEQKQRDDAAEMKRTGVT